MPPSVHKLAPAEKRDRLDSFWRDRGHEPSAPECYHGRNVRTPGLECEPCARLRKASMEAVKWTECPRRTT